MLILVSSWIFSMASWKLPMHILMRKWSLLSTSEKRGFGENLEDFFSTDLNKLPNLLDLKDLDMALHSNYFKKFVCIFSIFLFFDDALASEKVKYRSYNVLSFIDIFDKSYVDNPSIDMVGNIFLSTVTMKKKFLKH